MPTPHTLLKRLRARLQQEEVRVPIQTAFAVLMAYFATSFIEPEDISWGVFSALFVVQSSIGGTISAALGRIAGAILGAVIAVALITFLGDDDWAPLIALLLGVTLMSFLTAKWPLLAYGLVTVTIIAVAPDFRVVEGALRKVLAIAIGSICGMVAAFAVFPVLARHSEQEYLAAALRSCGAYMVECTTCLVGDKAKKDRKAQDAIQRSIERARHMAREARIEDKTPAMGLSPFSRSLLPEIERFGYTLTLVDRFSDKPISEGLCRVHKDALLELASAVGTHLDKMADAVEAGKGCEEIDDAWQAYQTFSERVDESMEQEGLSIEDKEHMVAIKGAYGSVLSNMTELVRQVQGRTCS
ncbi:MAG TPA: FUSC family protein [Burkholderiaceae bacterium]|nr:FUSC family protein [Burkholderiaceae bacterium]